jgi:hypothetical protein
MYSKFYSTLNGIEIKIYLVQLLGAIINLYLIFCVFGLLLITSIFIIKKIQKKYFCIP